MCSLSTVLHCRFYYPHASPHNTLTSQASPPLWFFRCIVIASNRPLLKVLQAIAISVGSF